MTLTSDERARFLASLRQDEGFRDEVRREVLTPELITLPERFAAFVAEMHAFVAKMEAFVVEMHAFVAKMEAFVAEMHAFVEVTNRRLDTIEHGVGRLQDDYGKLRGTTLEVKIQANPGYYLRQHARKVRVVDLDDLLDHVGIDDMSDQEYAMLGTTDLIARGVPTQSGVPSVFVVEATWRPHTGDVDRLVVRREILATRDIPTVALIASVEPPNEVLARYATMNGVLVVSRELDEEAG